MPEARSAQENLWHFPFPAQEDTAKDFSRGKALGTDEPKIKKFAYES